MAAQTYTFSGATTNTTATNYAQVTQNFSEVPSGAQASGNPFKTGTPLLVKSYTVNLSTNSGGAGWPLIQDTSANDGSYTNRVLASNTTLAGSIGDSSCNFPYLSGQTVYYGFKKDNNSTTVRIQRGSASGYNIYLAYNGSAATTWYSGNALNSEVVVYHAPNAPSVTATVASSSQINLSWTTPTDNGGSAINGYSIFYQQSGGSWQIWPTYVSGTSASITGLSGSTTYNFRVCAQNGVTAFNNGGLNNAVYGSSTDHYMGAAGTASATTTASAYVVTYDAQGGSVSPSTATVNVGSSTTLPTPTKSGRTFAGWYSNSNRETGYVGSGGTNYTPSGSVTLYARWEYSSAFNANGGTSVSTIYVLEGNSLTLPSTTRSGYTFGGWYTNTSWTTSIGSAGSSYTPTSSATYYAKWTGTAAFNSQGGTSVSNISFTAGDSVTLPSTTRTGYTFLGWYTASSGGTRIGGAGSSYAVTSTTYYAQWSAFTPSWIDSSLNLVAKKGQAYTSNNSVSASYVASWYSDGLPDGLTFNGNTNTTGSSTSTITGTPLVYGSYTILLIPYNADGTAGDVKAFTVEIADIDITWADEVLATSVITEGDSYTDQVSVNSGPDVVYSLKVPDSLPPGLTLNSATGVISGIATTPGDYSFVVVATNANGDGVSEETATLTITVEVAGGFAKVWNGSTWVEGTVKVWSGSSWVEGTTKVWGGSGWIDSFSS